MSLLDQLASVSILMVSFLAGGIVVLTADFFIEKKLGHEGFLGDDVDYLIGVFSTLILTLVTSAELLLMLVFDIKIFSNILYLGMLQTIAIGFFGRKYSVSCWAFNLRN